MQLRKVFSLQDEDVWHTAAASKNTNGTEHVNQDSKQENTPGLGLLKAMEYLYKMNMILALLFIAAERDGSASYRNIIF